jgi:hypothetical protein
LDKRLIPVLGLTFALAVFFYANFCSHGYKPDCPRST